MSSSSEPTLCPDGVPENVQSLPVGLTEVRVWPEKLRPRLPSPPRSKLILRSPSLSLSDPGSLDRRGNRGLTATEAEGETEGRQGLPRTPPRRSTQGPRARGHGGVSGSWLEVPSPTRLQAACWTNTPLVKCRLRSTGRTITACCARRGSGRRGPHHKQHGKSVPR